jgi:exopolysaccharide production protein ExoQ
MRGEIKRNHSGGEADIGLANVPAPLALISCICFVAWLLRLDLKQAVGISRASWIPTCWMLVTASRPLSYWTPGAVSGEVSGSSLDRGFQIALLGSALLILVRRRFNWGEAIRVQKWLFLLLGCMLLSVLWSPMPSSSLTGCIREFGAVSAALVAVTEIDCRGTVQAVFRRMVYILIPLSVVLIKYYPEYGVTFGRWSGDSMWAGVTLHKNQLGMLCLSSGFFLIWSLIGRIRGAHWAASKPYLLSEAVLLAMVAWLLIGPSRWAASVTSASVLTVGAMTLCLLLWMRKHEKVLGPNAWAVILGLIVCLGTLTPLMGGATVGGVTSVLGRDETLTGRSGIWAYLVPIMQQQPLLGEGFGGFWTPERITAVEVNQAHNGYLEILLGLGIVGWVLMTGFLLSFFRQAAKELVLNPDWASLCVCFVLMASLHNFSESSYDSFTRLLSAAVLLLAVAMRSGGLVPARCSVEVRPDHDSGAGESFAGRRQFAE